MAPGRQGYELLISGDALLSMPYAQMPNIASMCGTWLSPVELPTKDRYYIEFVVLGQDDKIESMELRMCIIGSETKNTTGKRAASQSRISTEFTAIASINGQSSINPLPSVNSTDMPTRDSQHPIPYNFAHA